VLAHKGQPRYADLGEAAVIDRAVDSLRQALRDPKRADVSRLARAVDEKVMQPVRPLLGEARKVLISPDGALNLIPFAALVDERNKHLVERYSITYLTSGRDLLRLQVPRQNRTGPLVVANPNFGVVTSLGPPADQKSGRLQPGDQSGVQSDFSRMIFTMLPGTAGEARTLKSLLPRATVLTEDQATESALKQARGPNILHIATHGFFLEDVEQKVDNTRGGGWFGEGIAPISDLRSGAWAARIENPLLRSGLALAGFNRRRSGEDDGALTAMEAAGLDLWGTKLVVLSACDTGVGEVKNGEGVYGLRRALALAGSESQVMSLWPVSDKHTRDLMIAYYRALLRGEGRGEALRSAQLKMLRGGEQQHPYYWASFIQSGEWANLAGKR
jgi:CHAT domain-containing protein